MKIRPSDGSAGLPPEPEEVGGKSGRMEPPETSPSEDTAVVAKTRGVFPSEALDSLKGAGGVEELARRFLEMALGEYSGAVSPADLGHVEEMLQEYMGEDPFIQSKLERISSLLAKAR
jgi:hypothetical protein